MRPCYKFTAKTAKKPAVLALDDDIGFWGTQASDFRAQLGQVDGDELVVEINSPGGDVMAGLGMYHMLRNWEAEGKKVTTRVTGVAASIASVIFLAGSKREMPKNTFGMVHQPAALLGGAYTADELRDQAEVTDKIAASMTKLYMDRMGADEATVTEMLSKDTWLTAEECVEMGFATALTDEVRATAKFDLARADLPEHVAAVFKAEKEEQKPDDAPADPADDTTGDDPVDTPDTPEAEQIVAKAKSAGLEAYGPMLAVACTTVAEAETRIAAARQIVALCNVAGRPDDAKKAIKNNTPIADVRASLVAAMAEGDTHIDTSRKDEGATKPGTKAVASSKDVYAKRAAARNQSK